MLRQAILLIRNVLVNRLYTFLNILGLSVALLSVALICMWVIHESGYDKFNANSHRIYQINNLSLEDGMRWDGTPSPFAPEIMNNCPGVEQITRIVRFAQIPISYGINSFIEGKGISSDPEIFDIFSLNPVAGDAREALRIENTGVITESFAKRYFGDENPLGKQLLIDGQHHLTVQAVIEDIPAQSHLQFDFILSHELAKWIYGDDWGRPNYLTYILTHQDANPLDLINSINKVAMDNKMPNIYSGRNILILRALEDIYLDNEIINRVGDTGDKRNVFILSAVGLLILLMACSNYISITVSLITKKLNSYSIQRIHGASRKNLFFQSFSSSFLVVSVSFFISMFLLFNFLPWFSLFIGKELGYMLNEPWFRIILLLIFVGTVILSGIYPAILLSRSKPLHLFQTPGAGMSKNRKLEFMVGLQHAIAITLIICTIGIFKQLTYTRKKDLGFNKEHVLHFQLLGDIHTQLDAVKGELAAIPGVQRIAMKDCVPFEFINNTRGTIWRDNGEIRNTGEDNYFLTEATRIDPEYFKMMEVEFVKGRNFDELILSDKQNYILNEEAVRQMQLDNPLGQDFALNGQWGVIVGIIKDTYFKALYEKIQPQVFYQYEDLERESNYSILFLRIAGSDIPGIISQVEDIWNNHVPGIPFDYHFLDQQYDMLYKSDKRIAQLINLFSVLAIFIACLGLFGQSNFAAENRTKEIGIRKVNGAQIWQVILMLNMDFVKWVAIAFIIATPIASYALHKWLQNFAYKTEMSWWIFALAGMLALGIALLTVSWQSWRAARRNPVEALRYE